MESPMKHVIYAAAAISAFALAGGAFACEGMHSAAADTGKVIVAQQQPMNDGMAKPDSGDQDNNATSDENKPKE
jgi:hypothetical protein